MATSTHRLTLEEFEDLYAREKPYYEYLDGEAVQKKVATLLHGLLQKILMILFDRAGYKSACEVEMRIASDWRPKPDVIAYLAPVSRPYPTEPTEVVAEVLSPDDAFINVFNRCKRYTSLGFGKIFVFDPEGRIAWEWDATQDNLERVSDLNLPNGTSIPVTQLWEELERQLN